MGHKIAPMNNNLCNGCKNITVKSSCQQHIRTLWLVSLLSSHCSLLLSGLFIVTFCSHLRKAKCHEIAFKYHVGLPGVLESGLSVLSPAFGLGLLSDAVIGLCNNSSQS